MPTYQDDITKIKQARATQASLNQASSGLEADAQTFGDEVWKNIRQARADRGITKMQQGVGAVSGQVASDPTRIQDFAGADVRPSTVDRFTSASRARNLSTLGTMAQYEADVSGDIESAIGAGTNRLLASAALKKAEADKAQQEADSLIEEIRLKMDQERLALDKSSAKSSIDPKMVINTLMSGGDGVSYMDESGMPQAAPGGKFTKEMASKAIMADPDNASYYKGLYEFMEGEGSDEDNAQGMRFLLGSMEDTLSGMATGRFGGTVENIKSFFGDQSLRQFEQQKLLLAPQVAKDIMKLGRLSDEDRRAAEASLPQVSDTPAEIKTKIATLRKILEKNYNFDDEGKDYSLTGKTR